MKKTRFVPIASLIFLLLYAICNLVAPMIDSMLNHKALGAFYSPDDLSEMLPKLIIAVLAVATSIAVGIGLIKKEMRIFAPIAVTAFCVLHMVRYIVDGLSGLRMLLIVVSLVLIAMATWIMCIKKNVNRNFLVVIAIIATGLFAIGYGIQINDVVTVVKELSFMLSEFKQFTAPLFFGIISTEILRGMVLAIMIFITIDCSITLRDRDIAIAETEKVRQQREAHMAALQFNIEQVKGKQEVRNDSEDSDLPNI